jgi:hypothetical protein
MCENVLKCFKHNYSSVEQNPKLFDPTEQSSSSEGNSASDGQGIITLLRNS